MNLKTLYEQIRGPARKELAENVGVGEATIRAWAKGYPSTRNPERKRKPTMEQIVLLEKAHPKLSRRDLINEFYPPDGEK